MKTAVLNAKCVYLESKTRNYISNKYLYTDI